MQSNRKRHYLIDIGLLVVALLTGMFGAWGMFTTTGRQQFDEMDGMYPFFSLVLATVLFVILIIVNLIRWWRK